MLQDLVGDILSWKEKYKDIFYIKIKEEIYIFRLITRGEYFNIFLVQKSINYDATDIILKLCLLYPKIDSFDSMLAGDVDCILQSIIKTSGFSNEDRLLKDIEEFRNNMSVLDNQIVILICKAFPHLKPEDIDKLNYYQLLRYLTLSEAILDTKLVIEKPKSNDKINFKKDNLGIEGLNSNFKPGKDERGDVSA